MFKNKKVEELYTAVFGDHTKFSSPIEDGSSGLQSQVRQLKWKVDAQAKALDALFTYLGVDLERVYSEIGDNSSMKVVKTKKTK